MRGLRWLIGLSIVGVLGACNSTTPPSQRPPVAERPPTATLPAPTRIPPTAAITPTTTRAPTVASSSPPPVPPSDGPVTPTMAELEIGGERYAALGDPQAPLTIVEFTDYG